MLRGYTRFFREIRLELSSMVFVAGIILTAVAIAKYFLPEGDTPAFLRDIYRDVGMWIVCMGVVCYLHGKCGQVVSQKVGRKGSQMVKFAIAFKLPFWVLVSLVVIEVVGKGAHQYMHRLRNPAPPYIPPQQHSSRYVIMLLLLLLLHRLGAQWYVIATPLRVASFFFL